MRLYFRISVRAFLMFDNRVAHVRGDLKTPLTGTLKVLSTSSQSSTPLLTSASRVMENPRLRIQSNRLSSRRGISSGAYGSSDLYLRTLYAGTTFGYPLLIAENKPHVAQLSPLRIPSGQDISWFGIGARRVSKVLNALEILSRAAWTFLGD